MANHFAAGEQDFIDRVKQLSPDELSSLTSLILTGHESVGCIPPDALILFVEYIADTLSLETAKKIIAIYQTGEPCEG